MEQSAGPVGDRGDGRRFLHHPDLVVHRHDADQQRGHGQRRPEHVRIEQAVGADRQEHRLESPRRPRSATDCKTHLCSVATVTIRRRAFPSPPIRAAKRAAPLIAILLLSVAPEVNTISRGIGADQRRDLAARASPPPLRPGAPSRARRCAGCRTDSVNQGNMACHDPRIAGRRGLVVQIDEPLGRRRSGAAASCQRMWDQAAPRARRATVAMRVGRGERGDVGPGSVPRQ